MPSAWCSRTVWSADEPSSFDLPSCWVGFGPSIRLPSMRLTAALRPFDRADDPPAGIDVSIDVEGRGWAFITFVLKELGSRVVVPELSEPSRTDGLWRTTCVEVFAQLPGGR